jgi:hypothetical protein
MNLTLETAKRLARAVDTNAVNAFARAVFAHNPALDVAAHHIAAADEGDRRAAARREAVQRILRRKGFVVDVLPVGFVTIVRAP